MGLELLGDVSVLVSVVDEYSDGGPTDHPVQGLEDFVSGVSVELDFGVAEHVFSYNELHLDFLS